MYLILKVIMDISRVINIIEKHKDWLTDKLSVNDIQILEFLKKYNQAKKITYVTFILSVKVEFEDLLRQLPIYWKSLNNHSSYVYFSGGHTGDPNAPNWFNHYIFKCSLDMT